MKRLLFLLVFLSVPCKAGMRQVSQELTTDDVSAINENFRKSAINDEVVHKTSTETIRGIKRFSNTVYGSSVSLTGTIVSNTITPRTDSTYNLGATGKEWANLFVDTITFSKTIIGSTISVTGSITGNAVKARTDSTYSLGAAGTEWLNLFVDSVTVTNKNSILKIKVGTLTSPGSAGLGAVTGVGFKPRLLILGYGAGDSSAFLFALGWTGGVGNNVSIVGLRSDGSDSGGRSTTTGALIEVCNAAGTVTNTAVLDSFDTDGFTINWTTVSGANTYGYIAIQ